MPGASIRESTRIVAGELPDLLHVVELPARGPGADMIGRTGGLMVGVDTAWGLETTTGGWRVSGSRGAQMRRAVSYLGEDLDALEEAADGYRGPLKCQVAGPWTMAASVELPSGERVLRDSGAVNDLAEALSESMDSLLRDLRRRFPLASALLIQVDEPWLPAVLSGTIGTASGLSRYAAVDSQIAGRVLSLVMEGIERGGGTPGVHCCGDQPPIALMRQAGARFVSIDLTSAASRVDGPLDIDLGALIESEGGLIAGTVPATGAGSLPDSSASAPLRSLLHRLGLEEDRHLAAIAVSPACGLAGATPVWARTALAACGAIGRVLRQDEGTEVKDGA